MVGCGSRPPPSTCANTAASSGIIKYGRLPSVNKTHASTPYDQTSVFSVNVPFFSVSGERNLCRTKKGEKEKKKEKKREERGVHEGECVKDLDGEASERRTREGGI